MPLSLALALSAALIASSPNVSAAPPEQTLAVAESEGFFVLSLPVSRPVMKIPKGSLATGEGADGGPTYFYLSDAAGIVISGSFEPAGKYPGLEALWKSETDAWKQNKFPKPKNVSTVKVDGWDVVTYDNDVGKGSNTHIRSQWVASGTWIDVHISVTTTEPIDVARATAMSILKSIQISEAE